MISETGRWQRDDKIWETDPGYQRIDHFGSGMDKDTCYQRAGRVSGGGERWVKVPASCREAECAQSSASAVRERFVCSAEEQEACATF